MIPGRFKPGNRIEKGVYAGDTWRGFTIQGVAGGDDPTELIPPVVSAKLQFRTLDKRFVYELNTETGSENGLPIGFPDNETGVITIEDPVMWRISVNSQILPMEAGTYLWELEAWDTMNVKRSLLQGRISICQDRVR